MKFFRVLLALLGLAIIGFITLLGLSYLAFGPIPWKTQYARMQTLIERAQPLIDAIERYNLDNSQPPQSLADLVPRYIADIPSTGLDDLPTFHYYFGQEAKSGFAENTWVLTANTSRGVLNFDMMLFFPNQQYPETGYGGRLEPMGKWAYVHE